MKYVLVTGGVLSGIGKGVSASSIGLLLRACGLRVTAIKIDPYLNVDAGTMSPFEHGEVFVLNDGGEVDLDLGNYERFMNIELSRHNNITTGKVYQEVIERERRGDYLGKTVQVVPHVTDAIQDWIERTSHMPVDGSNDPPQVCVIELGGTIGDIESMPFVEALRQFAYRVGNDSFCLVHLSLVPLVSSGEQKTKPTQHSVKDLRSLGLSPDLILCRSSAEVDVSIKSKIAFFCQVAPSAVVSVHDVPNLYHVPLLMLEQGVMQMITNKLHLPSKPLSVQHNPLLSGWSKLARLVDTVTEEVVIAVVGKYTGLLDSYQSVIKALQHSAIAARRKLVLNWINAVDLEPLMSSQDADAHEAAWNSLKTAHGVLVPGGFGDRGTLGKVLACEFARKNKLPALGICLGMQTMVIEYARNVLELRRADSTEFDESTPDPVIVFMPEISRTRMGGTMRLGLRRTVLKSPDCLTARLYGVTNHFDERHRHRYEVNPEMVPRLEAAGLMFYGHDETVQRMEVCELKRDVHPFYVGCQAHPEFKSHPGAPSPLYHGLVLAASGQLDAYFESTSKASAAAAAAATVAKPSPM